MSTDDAGRGMLVADDATRSERERLARAMEATIRTKRRSDWSPD